MQRSDSGLKMELPPEIHVMRFGFTRCFLLPCEGGYLQIDTSYPRYGAAYRRRLQRMGIELSSIKFLLLTHHHDDHAGFAAELVAHSGCRVVAHRGAADGLAAGCSQETMQPYNRRVRWTMGAFRILHRRFTFPPLRLGDSDIVVTTDDTQWLPSIGIDGQILSTPGHTADSISVLLSNGCAFVGDVAMNFLRFTGIRHHPIYLEDLAAVQRSWAKILSLGARTIVPSHGPPFSAAELRVDPRDP